MEGGKEDATTIKEKKEVTEKSQRTGKDERNATEGK
jgi:hypothetical protein